jgi:DNA-binding winged helix-turn-helix (wHTH) protein
MSLTPDPIQSDFRLDDWLVQPAQCRLSKADRTRQVRPKVMDLLTYLAARRGEVVSKNQLLDGVWGTRSVSESALTRTVTELRQAVGDNAEEPRLLETIPKRGYRLIGSVSVVPAAVAPVIAPRPWSLTDAKPWLALGSVALALIGCWIAPRLTSANGRRGIPRRVPWLVADRRIE